MMNNPGGPKYHHIPRRRANDVQESWIIVPQLIEPTGPRPKNDRNASVKMAVEIVSTACAKMSGMTFGRMCLQRMWLFPAPIARARSTNSRSRKERTWDRTIRVIVVPLTTAYPVVAILVRRFWMDERLTLPETFAVGLAMLGAVFAAL